MEATLSHSYALCPKLQEYWYDILEDKIEPDPIFLWISGELMKLNVPQQRHLVYGIITAKKPILEKNEVPSFKNWLVQLTDSLHLKRNRFILKDKLRDFDIKKTDNLWSLTLIE